MTWVRLLNSNHSYSDIAYPFFKHDPRVMTQVIRQVKQACLKSSTYWLCSPLANRFLEASNGTNGRDFENTIRSQRVREIKESREHWIASTLAHIRY